MNTFHFLLSFIILKIMVALISYGWSKAISKVVENNELITQIIPLLDQVSEVMMTHNDP